MGMLKVIDLRFENIKNKYQSLFWIVGGFSIIVFLMIGGWTSIINSVDNVRWLKSVAQNGVDQQLLFPLGMCGDSKVFSQEIERNAPPPKSLYLAGLAALRMGDLIKAEQSLQQAMDEGISPYSSPYALGVVYYLEGKDAKPSWSKFNTSQYFLQFGKECVASGSSAIAINYYKFALDTMKPNNREGYKQLTEYFAGTKDQEAFNKSLQAYLELAEPNSLEYHRTLGNVLLSQKQYSLALDHFLLIIKFTPDDPLAWYSAGQSYLFLKEYDKAREALTTAISIDPNNLIFYVYMGHSYLYQQQFDEAGVWYEKALDLSPVNVWAMTHLVQVRIAQKRYDDALTLITRAMELDQRAYIFSLATDVAAKMGNWDIALNFINTATNLEPDNLNYYRQYSGICEALADNICMKDAYYNILRLDPSDSDVERKLNNMKP